MRRRRVLWKLSLAACCVVLVASLIPRQAAILLGELRAAEIVGDATGDEAKILAAAKWVSGHYAEPAPNPAYYRIIPYLTHRLLPEPFRVPVGAIEFLSLSGECDSAARGLLFLLKRLGYPAEQLNMITHRAAAHSAVVVRLPNDRKVYVDPFFGIAAHSDGRLESIDYLEASIKSSVAVEAATLPLRDDPLLHFYESWERDTVFSAAQGENPHIVATLPATAGHELEIGAFDGSSVDVMDYLRLNGFTPFFYYVGSRYDRAWTRTLIAVEDVRIEFVLTDAAADPEIVASSPAPQIEGRTISWSLQAGERLVLYDNKAPLRLFRPSFQAADVIRIIPEDGL